MSPTLLLRKYAVPGPRYTSYPTVPYWDRSPSDDEWKEAVRSAFRTHRSEGGLSVYVHLPYCESLCTYCGCNTRITVNHGVETPYIDTILKEWALYLATFGGRPLINELHLGGGTPTFFSAANLARLVDGILSTCDIAGEVSFSIEGHPNNTTDDQMQVLFDRGFRRISFGIQDMDPEVQRIIHRIQPAEKVESVTAAARRIGFTSVNYDIIYGLPKQNADSIRRTVAFVVGQRPDRIAFYSYAHVPWMKPGQRSFTEADLPADEVKRNLYELGRALLEEAGYQEIGMDHFALPGEALHTAWKAGTMHRNFMGYTTTTSKLMIGLGASSISDAWTAFAQNLKRVEDYQAAVEQGNLPIYRGHLLNDEDLLLRQHILDIICHFRTTWDAGHMPDAIAEALERLNEPLADGLVRLSPGQLEVTEAGKPFVRNICMAFDARLWRKEPGTAVFSNVI